MAAEVLGSPVPLALPPASAVAAASPAWPAGPADPMTWRDLAWCSCACTVGLRGLAAASLLLLLVVVTGSLWWYGVGPIMRARCALDRWLLSHGHTEQLEQRVAGPHRDPRRHRRPLRRRAAPHRARPARRRAGPAGRPRHDPRAWPTSCSPATPRPPGGASREARATTGAALGDLRAVVRGIHPPVLADRGLAGAVEALALDMAVPVTVERRPRRAAAGAGRVGGLLRGRRVPGQHRQARRSRARLGRDHATTTACCARWSATTVAGGARSGRRHRHARASCGDWRPLTAR